MYTVLLGGDFSLLFRKHGRMMITYEISGTEIIFSGSDFYEGKDRKK